MNSDKTRFFIYTKTKWKKLKQEVNTKQHQKKEMKEAILKAFQEFFFKFHWQNGRDYTKYVTGYCKKCTYYGTEAETE